MTVLLGDCRQVLRTMADNSVDAIITDPPYELGFMGKSWDLTGVAYDITVWQECLRVLKPGGHLLAFGGSRTYHRLAVAIEDAGFQIRDQIMWVYGSGFPKSLNIGKAIDKAAGAEREVIGKDKAGTGLGLMHKSSTIGGEFDITAPATDEAKQWEGWGTALKPAHEPIVMARKPLDGTVANNVLVHGVGGINIDGCRVGNDIMTESRATPSGSDVYGWNTKKQAAPKVDNIVIYQGRFPANFIHDGSDEVLELFPESNGGAFPKKSNVPTGKHYEGGWGAVDNGSRTEMGNGSAARFFYCAKAGKKDRNEGLDNMPLQRRAGLAGADRDGQLDDVSERWRTQPAANHHPTVKPTDLMRYLCRLVTPPNGTILDPFTGSGSTGKAAVKEGFNFIGIEKSAEYVEIATARIKHAKENQ